MADNADVALEEIHAFPAADDDNPQGPGVLAQIVDDMDERGGDGEDEEEDGAGAEGGGDGGMVVEATGSGTFIPPQAPSLQVVSDGVSGFYVRLTLSVGSAGAQIAPGLEIDDCGRCPFCLDKPKYGGPGTKRQKCELKQQEASIDTEVGETRIWATMHMITMQEREQMLAIAKMPLPEPLVNAIDGGPLPLVWAYRRKRRARTLPPAYVLMYYCEDRVPVDRSHLAVSRQRYFKNSRSDLATTDKSGKARKPRLARPRIPTVTAYGHEQEMHDGLDYHGHPVAAAPHMGDHSAWQGMPHGTVVYGQPVAQPQMYAGPSVMYAPAPSAYGHVYAPPMYAAQPHYPATYPPAGPPPNVPPMSDGYGYPAGGDPYYGHAQQPPPPADMGHGMSAMDEEDPATSWIQDPSNNSPDRPAAKRNKRNAPAAPAPAPEPEAAPAEDDGNAMSNKTLDLMLGRLQGQLPPATYEKVIKLVRDVQCRRMSLSRSEFLQHFQAICAGTKK